MKKVGFVLLTSILIPTIYNGRKYYVFNKMVTKYEKDNIDNKISFWDKLLNIV